MAAPHDRGSLPGDLESSPTCRSHSLCGAARWEAYYPRREWPVSSPPRWTTVMRRNIHRSLHGELGGRSDRAIEATQGNRQIEGPGLQVETTPRSVHAITQDFLGVAAQRAHPRREHH